VIVVFDDASTDGTALLKNQYPQIQWIISAEPKGLMYARNLFLDFDKEAVYFCSLDDDAYFMHEDAIKTAVAYLDNNSHAAAIAFDILTPDDENPVIQKDIHFSETNMYIGCGHILTIAKAKECGGYLKSPGFYGSEEKDLCLRLIHKGYSIIQANGLYVWHDKTNIARNLPEQHRSGVCNDLVFTYRRVPSLLFVPVLLYKLFSHFKFSVSYKKAALTQPCLKGFADFRRFLFSADKQRQPVSIKAYRKFMSFQ